MARVEEILNAHYDSFNENEKYICHYLTGHYQDCAKDSIAVFSKKCNVSQTMLVRFAKKTGMAGYGELKARIRMELEGGDVSCQGLMERVTQSYHKMLDDMMKKDFANVFELIKNANQVFIYGSGSSQARVASEMKRIFLPVKGMTYVHGHDMVQALQRIAHPEDLVIIISLSGESDVVVDLAKMLRVNHVPMVSITRLKNNTLASIAAENLYIHSVQMSVGNEMEYEISTPYFILIEFLYLSYCNFLAEKR
ncbi:MAG: MurR/RpiR family transcriptional regulator [Clostridiales bacterium]|nr:MurR/RpiR family transcriptional regulator [Clostridiales bacterium]